MIFKFLPLNNFFALKRSNSKDRQILITSKNLIYVFIYSLMSQEIFNLMFVYNYIWHSAIKGHVPNQSLYKGWEQSFSCFYSWSENGHYFLSRLSNSKMLKWNLTFLGLIISKGTCVYMKYNIMEINFKSNDTKWKQFLNKKGLNVSS